MSCNQLIGLHAINCFKIAEKFPKDKDEVSYPELSRETGLPVSQLRRTLRQAMTQRIFTEPTNDTVAHTAASKILTKPHVHERIGWTCDEMWPACAKVRNYSSSLCVGEGLISRPGRACAGEVVWLSTAITHGM